MSELRVKELRERYTPKPAPKCHICGAEMMSDVAHNNALLKCREAFISACREAGIECEVV